MIRRLLIAAVVVALAGPAAAADKKKEKEGEPAPSKDVDLTPVAVPIVVGGLVRNYIFVTVRITASSQGDPTEIRQQEPVLRDAVVRTVHRTPMVRADNYNLVDEPRLIAALTAQFQPIIGRGKFRSISIPRQQPKNVVRMPKKAA